MKIAIFMYSFVAGGTGRISLTLAGEFAARGHHVDYLVTRDTGRRRDEVSSQVRVINFNTKRIATSLYPLARYLRSEEPTHLISLDTRTNVVACWARRLAKFRGKVIVCEHAVPDDTKNPSRLRSLMPLAMKASYSGADGLIAVSEYVGRRIAHVAGIDSGGIEVIYNPVVDEHMLNAANEEVDHPWFSAQKVPVVVAAGRMAPVKDFGTLIEAFAILRRRRPVRLIIFGEGGGLPGIKGRVASYGLADDVWLPGYVRNPYKYMAKAAAYVLSSQYEALPTAVIEALALGVPVVATDCPGGIREIVEDGKWAALAPVGSPSALATALEDTLDGELESRRVAARDHARQKFWIERSIDQYLRFLEGL